MGYALYAQHQLLLEPCPLCVLQRFAVIGLGIVFLISGLHNPAAKGRYVYAAVMAIAMVFGATVAAFSCDDGLGPQSATLYLSAQMISAFDCAAMYGSIWQLPPKLSATVSVPKL